MADNIRQALVLVGGIGSRLGDLTKQVPKPLLEVGGKPFLTYIVDEIFNSGVQEVILLAGYKGEIFEDYCTCYPPPAGKIMSVIIEREPLGTGGAVAGVYDSLDEHFLLLNGDTMVTFTASVLKERLDDHGAKGAVVLSRVADTSRYGRVVIDPDTNIVKSFSEKIEESSPGLINSGVYLLSKELFSERRGFFSLEQELIPSLVANSTLRGVIEEPLLFIDIGVPEDLRRAREIIPTLFK